MEVQRNHEQIHPSEQPSLVKSPRHKHQAQSRLRTVAVLRNPKTQHKHTKKQKTNRHPNTQQLRARIQKRDSIIAENLEDPISLPSQQTWRTH